MTAHKDQGGRLCGPLVRLLGAGVAAAAAALAGPGTALAHSGAAPAPHDLPAAWSWEPPVVLGIVLSGAVYSLGLARLWRRAGFGRVVGVWHAAAFGAGLGALVVALVSPLDALSGVLFSAHMVQHLMLILVAAPLLVLGAPVVPVLLALPRSGRGAAGRLRRRRSVRRVLHVATAPLPVLIGHVGTLWVWHLPVLYEAALAHPVLHALEHGAFLGTAIPFWWVLVAPLGRRLDPGAGALYILVTAAQGGALGALITFAREPWYATYDAAATTPWSLTPVEDQQLAGLIMWIPAGVIYSLAAGGLFIQWLGGFEDEQPASERRPGPGVA